MKNIEIKIGVIGLGYVGLPLAVEFGKKYDTIGFDINESRIKELKDGYDRTLEVEGDELKQFLFAKISNGDFPDDDLGLEMLARIPPIKGNEQTRINDVKRY